MKSKIANVAKNCKDRKVGNDKFFLCVLCVKSLRALRLKKHKYEGII